MLNIQILMLSRFSHIQLFATLWMGFSGQEYWSGVAFPPPGDFPDPGIKPTSSALRVDSLVRQINKVKC